MQALLRMLRKKAQTLWLGYALALCFSVAIPITNWITLQTAMQRLRVAVPDMKGGYLYLDNVGSFDSATKIHNDTAKMAAETIFNRSPDGVDDPERLERLFNPETTAKATLESSRDAEAFKSEQIHQKIETGLIKEISVDNDTALVSVEAQILRTGLFNQRVFNDARTATIFFTMKLNKDIATNGRFPLVIVRYDTNYEKRPQ